MPWWLWLVDFLAIMAVLGIVAIAVVIARRRWIARDGGAFDLSVNIHAGGQAHGWLLGVGVYRETTVDWYRTFSLSWRPKYRLPRGELVVEGRREPSVAESYALHHGHVISTCTGPVPVVQIAMTPQSLTAFLAWLESSPPGRGVNQVW